MTLFAKHGVLFACALSAFVSSPLLGQEKTPFLKTRGGEIEAFFIGPSCAPRVQMLFESTSPEAFAESSTPASRLMNNAARVLSRQCAEIERITSKGVANNRVLYNGIAEKSTDWRLTELGGRSDGLFGAAGMKAGQKGQFAAAHGFAAAGALGGVLDGTTYCVRPDDSGACSGGTSFAAAGDGYDVTARYLLDEQGAEARLEYTATEDEAGFLCNPTADISIGVVGGDLSAEGRADYADMLRERVNSSGEEVCNGFREVDDGLELGTFDEQGRSLGAPALMQAASGSVRLRLDE